MSMIVLAAVLLSSQAASPPARSATDLTRDLNSAPPAAVPTPRPPMEEPTPAPPAPTTTAPAAQTTPPARTQPAPAPQAGSGSSLTRDLNSGPAATPLVTPTRPAATRTPTPAPAPSAAAAQPAAAAPSPSTPSPSTLPASTPAAPADPLAALPFRIDLPEGFTIEPSEAGPQAKVYAVKRDGRSFVMIYQGPASQFPIYDGQLIDAGGRASVVIKEDGRRRAVEHLFAKDLESRETHVWLSYLEGPDSAQAEQIAQSVEPR